MVDSVAANMRQEQTTTHDDEQELVVTDIRSVDGVSYNTSKVFDALEAAGFQMSPSDFCRHVRLLEVEEFFVIFSVAPGEETVIGIYDRDKNALLTIEEALRLWIMRSQAVAEEAVRFHDDGMDAGLESGMRFHMLQIGEPDICYRVAVKVIEDLASQLGEDEATDEQAIEASSQELEENEGSIGDDKELRVLSELPLDKQEDRSSEERLPKLRNEEGDAK